MPAPLTDSEKVFSGFKSIVFTRDIEGEIIHADITFEGSRSQRIEKDDATNLYENLKVTQVNPSEYERKVKIYELQRNNARRIRAEKQQEEDIRLEKIRLIEEQRIKQEAKEAKLRAEQEKLAELAEELVVNKSKKKTKKKTTKKKKVSKKTT